MLRTLTSRLGVTASSVAKSTVQRRSLALTSVRCGHGPSESAEDFDARYEKFLNRPDLDGWELRKAMNDLQGHDLVPEPHLVIAAMKACRRNNDYGLAVRYLEAVKEKCGPKVGTIWPYMLTQIKPTLDDLGILTPEEMGYDKPELAMEDVYDMH